MQHPVLIVGAGLAGLSCAQALARQGVPARVAEASDGVGGRVRTDVVDGFRLDRGFQVLLPAYPTTRAAVDLRQMTLCPFYNGALVFAGGRRHRIADPLRHPLDARHTLTSPLTHPQDALAVRKLIARARGPLPHVFDQPETTTERALKDAGVSDSLLNGFFRPFLGGVFLETDLTTSSRMLGFLFRMFAKRGAVVPRDGMQKIPDALAASLPPGTVRLNSRVTDIHDSEVEINGSETIRAGAVVIATDGTDAATLAPDHVTAPDWNPSTTLYFAADRPPAPEPILHLNGDPHGLVNSVTVMSNVSPAYAPAGHALIAASFPGTAPPEFQPRVTHDLQRFFGADVATFRHLRTYEIPRALPAQPPGWLDPPARPVRLRPGLYVCGDHRENGSIEGAIVSGRRAAAAVLADTRASA